jgi:G3E family GTPase
MSGIAAAAGPPRWPVSLLTGMLGSGKTTLLRRLLVDPALRGTAVLINEIGEIGLDHHLVEHVDGETVLLRSGCLCCTLRADLPQTLNALRQRWRTTTLDLRRVVIETTGLADPGPILVQLATNPLIADDFPFTSVVTTVDAQHATTQLASRSEARRQIAVADHIVLTKTDLVDIETRLGVERAVRRLNSTAAITSPDATTTELFLGGDGARAASIRAWAGDATPCPADLIVPVGLHHHHHHDDIVTLSLRAETALDWPAVHQCLAAIVDEFAPDLLRLKGIIDVVGSDRPVVLHAVHDAFYPLEQLAAWPDADHRSRLVLIVDALGTRRIRLLNLATSTGIDWRRVV